MGYLVLLDTLITIHQEVMGYLVLLDTLITIHQEVMGYLVLSVRNLDYNTSNGRYHCRVTGNLRYCDSYMASPLNQSKSTPPSNHTMLECSTTLILVSQKLKSCTLAEAGRQDSQLFTYGF
jgi:hypothetical protein